MKKHLTTNQQKAKTTRKGLTTRKRRTFMNVFGTTRMRKTRAASAAAHSTACSTSHGHSRILCCLEAADQARRASDSIRTMQAVTGMARKS